MCVSAAVPRRPCSVQAAVTGGAAEDKEREEAEADGEEAEDHREQEASGQRPSGPEEPGVCSGAVPEAG